MTTLSASEARIPPEHFNRVVYQGEILQIERRDGPSVYVISEDDWKLLQAARERHTEIVREASKNVGAEHHELMRRLSE